MAIQVIAVLPASAAAAKNKADIAMFPFPAADTRRDLKIPAGVAAGLGASAKGKHLAEAKKFIELLGRAGEHATSPRPTHSIPLVGADAAHDRPDRSSRSPRS